MQGQQVPTTVVRPVRTATIDVVELEARERASTEPPPRKKIENEPLLAIPRNLPVPPTAQGPTYRVVPSSRQRAFAPAAGATSPAAQFPALIDNLVVYPPDMGGAVGAAYVMTALNSQVRVQDRNGNALSTVSLNGFFLPLVGGANVFDPKVLFDPAARRWIVIASANSNSPSSALLVAVSATDNPSGIWTGYAYDVDATNVKWFDYPSIGFNKHWVVATGNLFQGSTFQGSQVWIFDKAALYTGGTVVPSVANLPASMGGTIVPAVTYDDALSIEYLVSDWNGNSGGNGYLRLFTITNPGNPVFTATNFYPNVAAPWRQVPPAAGFASQMGSSLKIMNNDSRVQNAVYRHGSLWCAQSAFLPATTATRTAAQWWQIDPTTGATQQFGRVEDTSGAFSYAFPTLAVNAYKDVLLGYSSFSASQFAAGNYSLHMRNDAPGATQPTVQFKAGSAIYEKGNPFIRWGDYSSTWIDPDDFSFWTLQEYAETHSGANHRWGTEWSRIVPPIADLYAKDRTGAGDDTGAEPDPTTLPMWESDDIWVRRQQDGLANPHAHQSAEFRTGTTNPNYVYVKVRNRGGVASAAGTQLVVYWAKASSGLSWPDPWNGGIFFDVNQTMLAGNVIGTVTLPAIPPGGDSIQELAWNPPDPALYAAQFGPDQHHFCLLARIVEPMTFPETGNFYGNVQNNNNIVWKNISVYDLLPGAQQPGSAMIANFENEPMNAKVKFEVLDANGVPGLLNRGSLTVRTSGPLAALLERTRPAGRGIQDLGGGAFGVTGEGATLEGIRLAPREWGALRLVFTPRNPEEKRDGLAMRVTQLASAAGVDRFIGGQTLVAGKVNGFRTSGGGTTATPVRHLEFPAASAGSALPSGQPIQTSLPCYGPVPMTISAVTPAPAVQPITNVPLQAIGPYSWSAPAPNLISMNNTSGSTLQYSVKFSFPAPVDPSRLFLLVAGLARTSTARVSVPVTKAGEYTVPGKDLWCTTKCPAGTALTVLDAAGTTIRSGHAAGAGTDDRNTGYALFRPNAPLTTLTVTFRQQVGDGMGFTLLYRCGPCEGVQKVDPDFRLTATLDPHNAQTYGLVAAAAALPPGAKFAWRVEELDLQTGAVLPKTTMENPAAWWANPLSNAFAGYPGGASAPGIFRQGRKYRITRSVWSECTAGEEIRKVTYLCSSCDR